MSNSFVTPWTVAWQAPPSMGFPREEYWDGLPFPSLGDLPDPGIEPKSPMSPALAGGFFTTKPPGKPWNVALAAMKTFNLTVRVHQTSWVTMFIVNKQ